jgi:hypothetical protein
LSTAHTFTHHPALSGFSDANNAGVSVSQIIFLDMTLINKVQQVQHVNIISNKWMAKERLATQEQVVHNNNVTHRPWQSRPRA